jgi:hypothetical protein
MSYMDVPVPGIKEESTGLDVTPRSICRPVTLRAPSVEIVHEPILVLVGPQVRLLFYLLLL